MLRTNKMAAFCRVCLAMAGLALAQSAVAQSSFGGGSFGGQQPAPAAGAAATPAPPAIGDGFGGSFGGAEAAATQPSQPPAEQPAPAVGGSDFNGGGSFGGDFVAPSPTPATPGTAPPSAPVAAAPSVPSQQPVAQQPPGMQFDPQILAFESRDFGVPPTQKLRQNQFQGPTPTSLPGGNVVSTEGLATAMNGNMQMLIIDVLGANYSLPNAFVAIDMASPGSLNDRMQQRTAQWLGQITGGQQDVPIVVYCSNPMCWLAYNAALRAIAAGYNNVYWYRGGLQAWKMAGLPLFPASY